MKHLFNTFQIAALVWPSLTMAATLTDYRTQLKINSDQAADKRLSEIRTLLGDGFQKLELVDDAGKAIQYPSLPVRPKHSFSSTFFKKYIQNAARDIRLQDMYGVEAPVILSKTQEEIDAERLIRNQTIFDAALGKQFESIVTNLSVQLDSGLDAPDAALDANSSAYESTLTGAIARLIARQEPSDAKLEKISVVLGTLKRAEVFDHYVTRLVFQKNSADKNNPEPALQLSLGMLVSTRTNQDPYFIESLRLFNARLRNEADNYFKRDSDGNFKLDGKGAKILKKLTDAEHARWIKLEDCQKYVESKYIGARFAAEELAHLKPIQINFLIRTILDLNASDTPTDGDLAGLSDNVSKKFPEIKDGPVPAEVMDLEYYFQREKDLRDLTDYLILENQMKTQKQALMKMIQDNKKVAK